MPGPWALLFWLLLSAPLSHRKCWRRRKQRESKRYAKQVQAEARKEKVQAKKAAISDISKLRRQRQRDGFAGELDMDAQLDAMDGARSGGGAGARSGASGGGQNRRMQPRQQQPQTPLGQRIRPGAHAFPPLEGADELCVACKAKIKGI